MEFLKKHKKIILISLPILLLLFILIAVNTSSYQDDSSDCGGGSASSGSIINAHDEEKNAKAIYTYLRTKGGTPAGICGLLGNWSQESTLNPSSVNSSDHGSGLGQWTNTPVGSSTGRETSMRNWQKQHGNKWDDLQGQLDYAAVEKGEGAKFKSLIAENKSPSECADDFLRDWEGGWTMADNNKSHREAQAEHFYQELGAGDNSNTNTNGDADTTNTDNEDACSNDSAADGTGTVPHDLPYGINIPANKIPSDVKQFLLPHTLSDPRGVSGSHWAHPGNQCVDYSVSRTCALWGVSSWSNGNGGDQADRVIANGGVKDTQPHAGDIGSSQGFPPTPNGTPGHTWFVEHVFANGSVLLSEQNGPGSGEYAHLSNSWTIILMHPYPDGKEWKNANGGEYRGLSSKATFAHPKGKMKS